jgi:hypothetical protein
MTYLLSPDVTNPAAEVYIVNPKDGEILETHVGGLELASVETSGGVSRLLDAGGRQLEQYPGEHACFSFVEGTGVYGKCLITGALVTFKTRPQDRAFAYSLVSLP